MFLAGWCFGDLGNSHKPYLTWLVHYHFNEHNGCSLGFVLWHLGWMCLIFVSVKELQTILSCVLYCMTVWLLAFDGRRWQQPPISDFFAIFPQDSHTFCKEKLTTVLQQPKKIHGWVLPSPMRCKSQEQNPTMKPEEIYRIFRILDYIAHDSPPSHSGGFIFICSPLDAITTKVTSRRSCWCWQPQRLEVLDWYPTFSFRKTGTGSHWLPTMEKKRWECDPYRVEVGNTVSWMAKSSGFNDLTHFVFPIKRLVW